MGLKGSAETDCALNLTSQISRSHSKTHARPMSCKHIDKDEDKQSNSSRVIRYIQQRRQEKINDH